MRRKNPWRSTEPIEISIHVQKSKKINEITIQVKNFI